MDEVSQLNATFCENGHKKKLCLTGLQFGGRAEFLLHLGLLNLNY